MLLGVAPPVYRFFVPPNRQRQNLAGCRQAFEPLDRHEAVDRFEKWLEPRRRLEISLAPVRTRLDFEDDSDHRCSPRLELSVPATGSRNVRRSCRMSRFDCAKSKFARACPSALSRVRYVS